MQRHKGLGTVKVGQHDNIPCVRIALSQPGVSSNRESLSGLLAHRNPTPRPVENLIQRAEHFYPNPTYCTYCGAYLKPSEGGRCNITNNVPGSIHLYQLEPVFLYFRSQASHGKPRSLFF